MKKFSKQLFKDMFFIAVASATIAVGINLLNPRGYVLVSRSELSNMRIVLISTDEAKIKYDSKAAIFIDARETAEYDGSHIAGAINIPAADAAPSRQGKEWSFLDKPAEIVIYCDGLSCGASELLARKILHLTPRHLYIVEKGFPDWAAHDYPVQRGE